MIKKLIELDQVFCDIQDLPIKKLWKINENGNKVKVRRDAENEYFIILNGHYVTTLANINDVFEMIKTLIES
jgi:hypothetical protein